MNKIFYSGKLFKEVILFARENKIYWMVPLLISLLLVAFLVMTSQASTPFIYTLF